MFAWMILLSPIWIVAASVVLAIVLSSLRVAAQSELVTMARGIGALTANMAAARSNTDQAKPRE